MEDKADDINTPPTSFDSQKKHYENLLTEYNKDRSIKYENCIKKAIIARINEYKEGELDLSGFGFDDIKGYETRDVLQEVFTGKDFAPKLAKVQILNLSYNKLKTLPDISAFQNLTTIKLLGNDIEELPVVNRKQIENTDIFELEEEPKQDKRTETEIKSIEAEIKSITRNYLNLKEAAKMQYKEDCIKEIKKRINECSDGKLDLSGFGADEFDKDEVGAILNEVFTDQAFAGGLATVTSVDLSNNNLETLPILSAFTQLKILNLIDNEFKNIPVFNGCDKIEELNMSCNYHIETFTKQNALDYKNLQTLILSDMENIDIIETLPEALKELQIKVLSPYPFDDNFKCNSKLEILDITKLINVPNNLFTQLHQNGFSVVKILNMPDVSVDKIDASIMHFTNLEYLDISDNGELTSIHSNILKLPNLKTLIINQDCVDSLDEDSKKTLEQLKERGVNIIYEGNEEIEYSLSTNEGDLSNASDSEKSSSEPINTSNPVLGKRPAENQLLGGNNNAKRQNTGDNHPDGNESRLGTMANQTMANQEEEQKNEQKEELKQSEIDALNKKKKDEDKNNKRGRRR